jgi:hypothetical protein
MCCPSGARAGPFAQYSLSFGFPWNRPPRKRFAPETERVRSSGEEHAPTLPAPGGAGRLLPDLLSAPLPLSPPYLPSSSEASPPFGRPSLRQPAPNPRSTGRSRTAACGGGNRLGGRGLPPPHIPKLTYPCASSSLRTLSVHQPIHHFLLPHICFNCRIWQRLVELCQEILVKNLCFLK